jgi:hypothetical protein
MDARGAKKSALRKINPARRAFSKRRAARSATPTAAILSCAVNSRASTKSPSVHFL